MTHTPDGLKTAPDVDVGGFHGDRNSMLRENVDQPVLLHDQPEGLLMWPNIDIMYATFAQDGERCVCVEWCTVSMRY